MKCLKTKAIAELVEEKLHGISGKIIFPKVNTAFPLKLGHGSEVKFVPA